jgi:hypothetical protein
MKKSIKLTIATATLLATIGMSGVGLSYAHERWKGNEGRNPGASAHGGERHGGAGQHGHHQGKHRRHMMKLLKELDANADGSLTQAEIDEGRAAQLAKYDSDKNGSLSLKEFESLWLDMMRSRMVDRFQDLDEDGDAQVTGGEFAEPFAGMVERHDRNGDGALSKDDRPKRSSRGHGGGDDKRSD